MLAPGRASRRQKAPFLGRNFAHRGLHTSNKAVPENSLEAFRLARAAVADSPLTRDVSHPSAMDSSML